MKNNIVSLILIVLVVVTLFIGCGGPDNSSELTTDDPKETVSTSATIETDPSPVVETTEETEMHETVTETDPVEDTQGSYTLEEAQATEGVFIRYPDGSFDRYHNGYILTWDDEYMTYGTDYHPQDLIMNLDSVDYNEHVLSEGQLVLFWPYDYIVEQGLFEVEESGYSLFRADDDGKLEGLFLLDNYTTGHLSQWNDGKGFNGRNVNYTTINGVPKEQYDGFPSTESRICGSFPARQSFTIGVVEGTTLVEKEYRTDYMYLFHAASSSPYTLTPTTDGYAIFDFTDTPPGEYVFTISRWDSDRDSRMAHSTYIVID